MKINSKWIRAFNVRPKTIKTLGKSTGGIFSNMDCNSIFLAMSPEAREIKTKINCWDYIKMKSFYTGKAIINKTERHPTTWEKVFTNDISINS